MKTDITSAMNHEFSMAKWFRLFMLALQAIIAAASLVATGRSERWLGWYGVLVLVLAGLSRWMKQISGRRFHCAERYRRMLFFSKSHNDELPAHEVAVIVADYVHADKKTTLTEDEYYDSQEIPGNRRMLENLQESAFYTRKLSQSSLVFFRTVSVGGFLFAFVFLLVEAVTATGTPQSAESLRHAAEITTKLVAFAALGSYFDLWSNFSTLAGTSDRVYRDASTTIERQGDITKDVLKLVSTYDCALAASAPIPTPIWLLNKGALQKGWSAIKSKRSVFEVG